MPTASDSEQTTQPGRQSNSKASNTWLKIREILNNKWVLLIMIIIIWTPYFATGHEWNSPNVHWLPISLMLTIIFVTILFLWKKVWFLKNISQFNSWIFGVTIIGGTIAFLLPLGIANDFAKDAEGPALRQMLIYTTGGLLGVITLSETRRKNDQEKKKNKDEKKKNKQDHIRQVHAERRSRYAKAIEQLADEKAAIRLGGIYTLVGLVDEWLTDKDIKDINIRREEGQVIINNLCSYIRSPFLIAEKIEAYEAHSDFNLLQGYEAEFSVEKYSPQLRALYERVKESGTFKNFQDITADYAKFHEEQDVRRTIFVEMSKRSSTFNKNEEGDMIPSRCKWSEFEFDFSRAPIFYPLNHLTIEKGIFSYASFYGQADFNESTFIRDAAFNGVKFTQGAKFNEVTFNGEANFSTQGDTKTTFGGDATFNGVQFTQGANFNEVTFNEAADFSTQKDAKTTFGGKATFNGVQFTQGANFNEVTFNEAADFSTQKDAKTTFGGKATFNGAHFTQEANFAEVTFNKAVDFSAQGDIETVFGEKATFNDVQFHKEISFNTVIFEGIADFRTKKTESFNETFMSDAEFVNTHFKNTADFSYIHSYSNNNSHKIYFKQVYFHEDSLFNNTEFLTDVHFEEAVFHGEAKFNDASFLKSVKFSNKTNFQDKAIFSGITVWENTKFESVFFDDESYFNGATLGNPELTNQQKTCFYESRFDKVADFSGTHFYSINKFTDLYFHEEANFYGSEFADDTFFIQNPGKLFALNNFTSPKYNKKAEFSDAKFEGESHFENIEFNDGADFIKTIFYKESKFENILFKASPPDFEDAKFTVRSSHRFTTSQNSIPCRRKKIRVPRNNKLKARKIPIGSYLFDNDPDNPIAGPA